MHERDEQLKKDVEAELAWDPRVQASQIGVTVDEGAVSLFGTVETYAQKWAAEAAVRRVHGVRAFAEELSVKTSLPHAKTDQELTAAIARAFGERTGLPASLTAKVEQGWVTLYGEATQQFERQAAVALVGHLDGVVGVSNQITIDREPASASARLEIAAALRRRLGAAADAIDVTIDHGRATLTGSVATLRDAEDAHEVAWGGAGVVAVVMALRVEGT